MGTAYREWGDWDNVGMTGGYAVVQTRLTAFKNDTGFDASGHRDIM
jgi:hypothetical protein